MKKNGKHAQCMQHDGHVVSATSRIYTQSNALRQRVVKSSRVSGKQNLSVISNEILHAYRDSRCNYVQKGPALIDFCANPN